MPVEHPSQVILGPVRMGLVRAGAWAAATAAAVSVSWLGVHRVLGDASYEQPRMLAAAPVTSASSEPPLPAAIATPTQRPTPSSTPGPTGTATGRTHSPGPTAPADPGGSGSAGAPNGRIQGYNRPGGRIVVDMGPSSATVVTAVALPGWEVQQWTGDDWLRVDFMQGKLDSIFYVTWNGHAPFVQTWGP